MLATLMKTVQQVNLKFLLVYSRHINENNLDINECQPDPCVNGNCTDQINGYICTCNAGYSGKHCSTSKP